MLKLFLLVNVLVTYYIFFRIVHFRGFWFKLYVCVYKKGDIFPSKMTFLRDLKSQKKIAALPLLIVHCKTNTTTIVSTYTHLNGSCGEGWCSPTQTSPPRPFRSMNSRRTPPGSSKRIQVIFISLCGFVGWIPRFITGQSMPIPQFEPFSHSGCGNGSKTHLNLLFV